MTPQEIARIRDSFAAQSMMQTLGAELCDVSKGLIRIEAPILPGTRQQQGFGHAGLTFSIGDSAAGYAALTTLPLDTEVVTAEIKINLLAPARGDRLIASWLLLSGHTHYYTTELQLQRPLQNDDLKNGLCEPPLLLSVPIAPALAVPQSAIAAAGTDTSSQQ